MDELTWALWPWQQCKARCSTRKLGTHRCELRKGHTGMHAREYGMSDIRWGEHWPGDDSDG